MEHQLNEHEKEQFKCAIKTLVETHQALKLHNANGKQLRERLKSLKSAVLGFMESSSLEVCNVNHNGKTGEISIRTSKRIKTLKKDEAISKIEAYLSSETNVDQVIERAGLIWDAMQESRPVTEHKDISVKKL